MYKTAGKVQEEMREVMLVERWILLISFQFPLSFFITHVHIYTYVHTRLHTTALCVMLLCISLGRDRYYQEPRLWKNEK